MKARTCYGCAKYQACQLRKMFNIDENIGCVDFIDDNFIQKEHTNTLNKPVMDPRFGPDTFYAGVPFVNSSLVLNCEKIVLKQGSIEITIDDKRLEECSTIIINGRTYVLKED